MPCHARAWSPRRCAGPRGAGCASAAGRVKSIVWASGVADGVGGQSQNTRIGAPEGPVDHRSVAVRAFDDVGPFAYRLRQPGWIARHHPHLLAGVEQVSHDMTADVSGRRGDNDHGEPFRKSQIAR